MTSDEQLDKWVKGESVHNPDRGGECCPDFSCCNKKVDTPTEVRKRFQKATDEERHQMLMMFLGGAIEAHYGDSKRVHIAGDEPGTEQ